MIGKLLRGLATSVAHLETLDELFRRRSPVYRLNRSRIESLPNYSKLSELFYPRVRDRQFALGDLIQYALVFRGYLMAGRPRAEAQRQDFIRTLLRTVNLLLEQEGAASTSPAIRVALANAFEESDLPGFLPTAEDHVEFEAFRNAPGRIEANRDDPAYRGMDGLLPKSVGAAQELIVFACLIQRGYGYVIPLLISQRLFGPRDVVVAPDFLLVTRDGRIFGVEVGQGGGKYSVRASKIRQTNRFTALVSVPTVTALVENYRCAVCNKWILYCKRAIEELAAGDASAPTELSCVSCPFFRNGRCKDIMYRGRTEDSTRTLHYHLTCVLGDSIVQESMAQALAGNARALRRFVQYVPHFLGLEDLT